MLSLFVWKVLSALCLVVGVYLFGLAPLLLGNSISRAHVSLLSACSGGMLLGTTFIHLFPEVSEQANKFRCTVGITSAYPVGELLICAGLIAVMIIEQFVMEYENVLHGGANHHHHHHHHHHQEEEEEEEEEEGMLLMARNGKGGEALHHDHVSHFTPTHGGWSAYILVMALSIHSVLEGIAIGVSGSMEELVTLFISIIVHEVCLAFTLGLKLFTEGHTTRQFITSLSFFVISCPVGVIAGALVIKYLATNTLIKTVFILKALATGTFVQVTFFEILAPEFAERHANQLHKMAAVILGFLIISLTMYLLHDIPTVDFCQL